MTISSTLEAPAFGDFFCELPVGASVPWKRLKAQALQIPEIARTGHFYGGGEAVLLDTTATTSSFADIASSMENLLSTKGLVANRKSYTSDGSRLLEFPHLQNSCVDIYPNGTIVVIVQQAGKDHVFELKFTDLAKVPELLTRRHGAE